MARPELPPGLTGYQPLPPRPDMLNAVPGYRPPAPQPLPPDQLNAVPGYQLRATPAPGRGGPIDRAGAELQRVEGAV